MKKIIYTIFASTFLLVGGLYAQPTSSIGEIQGEGFRSEKTGSTVKIQGIVTAVRRTGFFVQTPDDKVDSNPKTSEGIFIYTQEDPPDDKVKIGNLLEVKGIVTEFRHKNEPYGLFITQLTKPEISVVSSDNSLPKPFVITSEFLNPKVPIDFLESLEGMRVQVNELLVVAPTTGYENRKEDKIVSDGVFFGVVNGTPRPFREAGLDALKVIFDKLPQTMPIFDMNPEMLRIDSDGINGGQMLDVSTGAKIKNMVGVMDYGYQRYTIYIDWSVKPTIEEGMKAVPVSPSAEGELTVASFNLENFFDDETNSDDLTRKEDKVSKEKFQKRLKKASLAVRNVLAMPDVLGIIEIENMEVLKKLAKQINDDAVANKQTNPKYEPYLIESNDIRGIDVAFLVKSEKVKVLKTEQLGADLKLDHKDANPKERLFDRPPFLLEAEITDAKTSDKLKITVINNHLKSYGGIDDAKDGNRVQNKRRLQAEFLAKFVSERQKADPNEKIALIGDFNAFQFNDGYNDLIGTLTGKPERRVLVPPQNVYETGLITIVNYISAENRYSYVYGGNAQVLDHILINKPMQKNMKKFGYARLNADFPEVYANDENRPERISDHDAPVLFLSIKEKITEESK